MKCIYCNKGKTEVINSREVKKGLVTWRRRSCVSCLKTFTTTENGYRDNIFVIKSNGSRQRFVSEKLFASIFSVLNSAKHRDNGKSALLAKKMTERVLQKTLSLIKGKDIKTSDIILITYEELKKVDSALSEHYIYYSEYRRKVGLKTRII